MDPPLRSLAAPLFAINSSSAGNHSNWNASATVSNSDRLTTSISGRRAQPTDRCQKRHRGNISTSRAPQHSVPLVHPPTASAPNSWPAEPLTSPWKRPPLDDPNMSCCGCWVLVGVPVPWDTSKARALRSSTFSAGSRRGEHGVVRPSGPIAIRDTTSAMRTASSVIAHMPRVRCRRTYNRARRGNPHLLYDIMSTAPQHAADMFQRVPGVLAGALNLEAVPNDRASQPGEGCTQPKVKGR